MAFLLLAMRVPALTSAVVLSSPEFSVELVALRFRPGSLRLLILAIRIPEARWRALTPAFQQEIINNK